MKKAVSLILSVFIMFSLCGCRFADKDFLSDINRNIDSFTEKTGYSNPFGITFNNKVDKKKITKIKKAKIVDDGIRTLCYQRLTKAQKSYYSYLVTAAENMPENWLMCGKKTDNTKYDISVAYQAMLSDNPRFFWMPLSYIVAENGSEAYVAFKIKEDDIKADYLITKETRDRILPEFNSRLNELVTQTLSYPSDFEKELFVHDYLCRNVEYDLDGGKLIYTSFGAIVNGFCVCEGYARAMQLVMQECGIKCGLIYGDYKDAEDSGGEGHMWNYINIGGEWYHLDVTWDRSSEFDVLHTYFNLSDDEIAENHRIFKVTGGDNINPDDNNFNILNYTCNSFTYNYYVNKGLVLNDSLDFCINSVYNSYSPDKQYEEYLNEITGSESDLLNNVALALYPDIELKSYTKAGKIILLNF